MIFGSRLYFRTKKSYSAILYDSIPILSDTSSRDRFGEILWMDRAYCSTRRLPRGLNRGDRTWYMNSKTTQMRWPLIPHWRIAPDLAIRISAIISVASSSLSVFSPASDFRSNRFPVTPSSVPFLLVHVILRWVAVIVQRVSWSRISSNHVVLVFVHERV